MLITIAELGLTRPSCIGPLESADTAIRLMQVGGVTQLVVADQNEVSGLLSDVDVVESLGMLPRRERRAFGDLLPGDDVLVADVMDADAPTTTPATPVIETAHLMLDGKRTGLRVAEGDETVGVVSDLELITSLCGYREQLDGDARSEAVLNHGTRVARSLRTCETLDVATAKLFRGRTRHLPVVHRDKLCGMLSDRDVYRAAMEHPDGAWTRLLVGEWMSATAPRLRPSDSLSRAAEVMRARQTMAIPITSRDGLLVSMLTATDLLRALVNSLVVET